MTGGPLAGVRVLELAGIGPGPFAAMLLAELGADVLRVDRPGTADTDVLTRSRRSVVLDLRAPAGSVTALGLAERADILLEGYRPGVTERLGLGPEDCWQRNPRLVYGRMTGWGQDGPWAHTAGHDIDYIAVTGALHAMGRAGERPAVPLNLVGDFGGGSLYLALGVVAALWEARESGQGQVVDAAIVDGAASLMTMPYQLLGGGQWRDERGTNLVDTGMPWYDVYETADGEWMAVGALEGKFYAEFVRLLLGVEPSDAPRDDPGTWPALRQRFAEAFAARDRREWERIFEGTDACVAPVLSMREAPRHPQVAQRATFVEHDGNAEPAPAPRLSRTPTAVRQGSTKPGEHTTEALTEWGIADVDDLLAAGVAVQA